MKILNESLNFTPEQIENICKVKNATYVCETTQKDNNVLLTVFRGAEAHPVSNSRYFALYFDGMSYEDGVLMITDGAWVTDLDFHGCYNEYKDEVIYSRHRHDYRTNGHCMIDGGRAYTRRTGTGCKMKVIDGELTVLSIGRMKYETHRTWVNAFSWLPIRLRYRCLDFLGKFSRR